MTYRDDRDATLARAEALEQDLKRAEAERDRLRAQLERLERDHTTPTPPPPPVVPAAPPTQPVQAQPVQAIVMVHTQSLTPVEIKSLLDEVEGGFARSRSDVKVLTIMFTFLLVGSVPLYFTKALILGVVFTVLGLVGSIANFLAGAMNDAPDVLASLRARPSEILELVEGKTTLTIVTRTKSADCWTPDRAELLVRLSRYCPDASVRRGAT